MAGWLVGWFFLLGFVGVCWGLLGFVGVCCNKPQPQPNPNLNQTPTSTKTKIRPPKSDPYLFRLLKTCLAYSIHDQGRVTTCRQGIPLGSPLSPLLGSLFLQRLDDRLTALRGVYYLRYMDDWVILAPTRWKLRKAIVCMNQTLAELCVEKHPDKTYIGRMTVGFDFLGYHFQVAEGEEACEGTAVGDTPPVSVATPLDRPSRDEGRRRVRLGVAKKTLQNFRKTCSRLYEQHASVERVGAYVKRWYRWFLGGLRELVGAGLLHLAGIHHCLSALARHQRVATTSFAVPICRGLDGCDSLQNPPRGQSVFQGLYARIG